MSTDSNINVLIGLTLKEALQEGSDRIVFRTTDDRSFLFYHSQDCCESVGVEKIDGDLANLVGSPILAATEVIEGGDNSVLCALFGWAIDRYIDSITVTVFTFETAKGKVVIYWVGESNGYYSESVSFVETTKGQPEW